MTVASLNLTIGIILFNVLVPLFLFYLINRRTKILWGKMEKVPAFHLPGFLTTFWALNSKFYSPFFSVRQVPARVPTPYKETRFLKSNKKGNSCSLRSLLHLFDEIRKDFLISRRNENWPVRGTDFPGKDAGTKNLKCKKKKIRRNVKQGKGRPYKSAFWL